MMNFIYEIPLYMLLLGLWILFPLMTALGFGLGRWARGHDLAPEDTSEFLPTTILGLLALILGFTYAMAVSRYEERQHLILKEANAIGTSYIRARTVGEPERGRLRENLKKYTELRIAFYGVGFHEDKIQKVDEETLALQKLIWADVVSVTGKSRDPVTALLMASVNDMVDLSAERQFATDNRVPEVVYVIILLITSVGLLAMGFRDGLRGRSMIFGTLLLSLLFSVVIVLIQDLDRPRRGLIRVDQSSLKILRSEL